MSGVNDSIYLRAVRFHASTDPNPEIENDLEEMGKYINELSPENVNASTLSRHRRAELERRIQLCFQKIEMKLHPVCVSPEQELDQQLNCLGELQNKLSTMRPREFYSQLKKQGLPAHVLKMVFQAVFIASGCPNEASFSKKLLKQDTRILNQHFPALTGGIAGTIFEQVAFDLRLNFDLWSEQRNLCSLEEIAADLRANKPCDQIRKKLMGLPHEFKEAIFTEAHFLGLGSSKDEAAQLIFNDVNLLKGLKTNHSEPGENMIEQAAFREKIRVEPLLAGITEHKIQFFKDQYDDVHTSRAYMKALFNGMHPTIQGRLREVGIQPPFYGRGFDPEIYKTLGAHYDAITGRTRFGVYAPNAQEIKLNLTAWKRKEHSIPMVKDANGFWFVETEHARPGRSYHFMVDGVKKLDPFAFQNIIHCRDVGKDDHESQVSEMDKDFDWTDGAWMSARAVRDPRKVPLSIYEVHVSSWMKKPTGESYNWKELAPLLARYCRENNYNAVELMAMFAHPQPISMGYQITSFFAPNSDMGTWEDFHVFVDHMHNLNINVFADWVPAHFALNDFSLGKFDGTAIFEDDCEDYAMHPTWGTYVFDLKKKFVCDFLLSNADLLADKLHIDGLRVDAVASMLYLNYDRTGGNRKNHKGSEVNLEAKAFQKDFNTYLHRKYPGIVTMAEESSAFYRVTFPVFEKGLGYDYTWHMGFMNDTLTYWKMPAQDRIEHFKQFLGTVQNVDNGKDVRPRGAQILAYSHDESANAKGTVLQKMAGSNLDEKYANGRLALAYQLLRGGGPVLDFAGNETLQTDEWHYRLQQSIEKSGDKSKSSFNWEELRDDLNPLEARFHRGAQASRRDLNHLYLTSPGLQDQSDEGLRWIHTDETNAILGLHRRGGGQQFACIFNTSDQDFSEYILKLPASDYAPELNNLVSVTEVYNTDHGNYGGQGRTNGRVEILRDYYTNRPVALKLQLPPFAAIVLEEKFS